LIRVGARGKRDRRREIARAQTPLALYPSIAGRAHGVRGDRRAL